MAVVKLTLTMNVRGALWFHKLAKDAGLSTTAYMNQVLLKHLNQTPGIDLSQSPYSQPKGVSNVEEKGK